MMRIIKMIVPLMAAIVLVMLAITNVDKIIIKNKNGDENQ
jgi:hypothetical protein